MSDETADGQLRAASELADRAPCPARIANVRTGTAGWTDASLIRSGLFYPKGTTQARARLEFYASHFSLVEVDATYYTLMPRAVSERWVGWMGRDFVFDIKAHPVLTGHPIDVGRLPKDLKDALVSSGFEHHRGYADRMPRDVVAEMEQRFLDFVEPLSEGGRLGCIMLQFPPWFRATRGNVRRLHALRDRLGALPVAVEFRHPSWLASERRARVLATLTELAYTYVVVDEPDVRGGGVPPVLAVTHPELAVVRFHGHNTKGWRRGASVAERFDYLYSEAELRGWVEPVRRLSAEARQVHAVFNNCVRNYAVVNAKGLAVLLGGSVESSGSSGSG